MDEHVKPRPPEAKKVFEGLIFSVWQWQQTLFDGTTATFERLARPDYACLIAVLQDQRIMLVEDEQPDRGPVITPAGGGVETSEEPLMTAGRELTEETGYRATEVIPWYSYRPSNKIDFKTHVFIGKGCTLITEPHLEAGEHIKPLFYSFEEFLTLGTNSQLRDLMLCIKLLEARLDSTKKEELFNLLYGS